MKIYHLEDCLKEHNKVFFSEDKTLKDIDVDKREELLKVDKYIEYTKTYDGELKAYTIYIIEDRFIDENNNLILTGKWEYKSIL